MAGVIGIEQQLLRIAEAVEAIAKHTVPEFKTARERVIEKKR